MYDVIIIGAGPAGLTAGIYCSRARLNTLFIDKMGYGGAMAKTWSIENYPGFKEVSGFDLATRMHEQAKELGCSSVYETVKEISNGENGIKSVVCESGKVYECAALIISSGTSVRKLGVKGEEEYSGKGVSYCGTCDGAFFKDKHIITVGGGDTAVDEAYFLTRYASKVTMIHRDVKFSAEKILQEKVLSESKIEILWKTEIKEIYGNEKGVTGAKLYNKETGQIYDFGCQGIFPFVGSIPSTSFAKDVALLNDWGYVKTDGNMKAGEGVFSCGDCRENSFKQIIVACGEGAVAAHHAEQYLRNIKK
jgi:thioredoxin reductase (NADPH)